MNWMGDQPTGSAYDVYQYYLGGGSPGGTPAGGGGGGITSLPWYQQTGGGDGRGSAGGGYGLFGNLDKSTEKIFNKNVWAGEIGGPANMYGGWKPQEVKGYYNSEQDGRLMKEGNIDHLGLEVPTMAGMLFDKNFGKGPQIGDIEGTFSKGWESGKGKIKKGWEEEKDKWSKIFSSKKSKAKKEKEL